MSNAPRNGFRSIKTAKAVDDAIAAITAADGELAKSIALRDWTVKIVRDYDDGSFPCDDLFMCAVDGGGVSPSLAKTVIEKGIELARGPFVQTPPIEAAMPEPPPGFFDDASGGAVGQDGDGMLRQEPAAMGTPAFPFDHAPYIPPDPAKIPKREWLYGKYYIRGVVSATLGRPGRLKSTVSMTDAVSMTVGLDLLNDKEPIDGGPLRVAYINGEENQDELDRRCAAICQRYEIKPDAYQGRLWLISTRDKPLRLAVSGKGGVGVIAEDVVRDLETWCDRTRSTCSCSIRSSRSIASGRMIRAIWTRSTRRASAGSLAKPGRSIW
jgi:hypothetical protein